MSSARVQFFSISLDGFGTGEGQSLDTPFGHAGERLHEWMFTTRWWRERVGQPDGTGGIDDASPAEALETAREAANGEDVRIGGGATVIRDFLAARLVDHMHVVVVPILLGRGVRLWDGLERLERDYKIEASSSPSGVAHLTFTR